MLLVNKEHLVKSVGFKCLISILIKIPPTLVLENQYIMTFKYEISKMTDTEDMFPV